MASACWLNYKSANYLIPLQDLRLSDLLGLHEPHHKSILKNLTHGTAKLYIYRGDCSIIMIVGLITVILEIIATIQNKHLSKYTYMRVAIATFLFTGCIWLKMGFLLTFILCLILLAGVQV